MTGLLSPRILRDALAVAAARPGIDGQVAREQLGVVRKILRA